MIKPLMLATCSLLAINLYAQHKFQFKIGDEYELPKRTEDLSFFGNSVDGIVNLALKNDELHIVRFDSKTLNVTVSDKIELSDATRRFNSEIVVDFGSNHYWLHSDYDKKTGAEYLYYDKIEVATNKISVSNKLLLQSEKIAPESRLSTVKYEFNFDAEHSKLLVSYRLAPAERNDKLSYDRMGFFVFDEHMNKLWGREYTMPYTEAVMDNSDFSVDSKGNAYLLAKVFDSDRRNERDKSTGLPAYHYEVLRFTAENNKITKGQIKIGDMFVKQVSLVESSTHEMIIASSYSKKASGNATDGIFLSIIDINGNIIKYRNGFYEFPLEELLKFESGRARRRMERKNDYEAPNLKVRNVLVEADGSVMIACEESYSVTYTTYINGVTSSYTVFYNEDIIAARINADGNMAWVRKISKRQRGNAPINTMSFKMVSDETGYYFLYLDNIKNQNITELEEPKYHIDGYGGQVMVSKIDKSGKVSKELLFSTRDEDIMIFPTKFTRLNGNQFVGRARVKKTLYKPVLITVSK